MSVQLLYHASWWYSIVTFQWLVWSTLSSLDMYTGLFSQGLKVQTSSTSYCQNQKVSFLNSPMSPCPYGNPMQVIGAQLKAFGVRLHQRCTSWLDVGIHAETVAKCMAIWRNVRVTQLHAVAVRVWPIIEILHLIRPTVHFQPNSTSCSTTGQVFCFGSTVGRWRDERTLRICNRRYRISFPVHSNRSIAQPHSSIRGHQSSVLKAPAAFLHPRLQGKSMLYPCTCSYGRDVKI